MVHRLLVGIQGGRLLRREERIPLRGAKRPKKSVGTKLALLLACVLALPAARIAEAAPISQGEWARLLAEAMGLENEIAPKGAPVSELIEFLTGDPPAVVRIEAVSADPWPANARKEPDPTLPGRRWLRAGDAAATPHYRVVVPRGGIYALRYRGQGGVQRWVVDTDDVRIGNPAAEAVAVRTASDRLPILLGYFILSRGEHAVAVKIPPAGGLQAFELVRQPFPHVRPPEGWKPEAALTYGAKAVTMVQAMQIENELPDLTRFTVQREGERFDAEITPAVQTNSETPGKPSMGAWVLGRGNGSWLVYNVDVRRWGTYSLLTRVTGRGKAQLWLDERVSRGWGGPGSPDRFTWCKVATLPLSPGRHRMDVYLEEDAGLDLLRLLYRDPRPEASLMVLRDLGFEEGAPDDPVSLNAARENLENPTFRERLELLSSSFFTHPGPGVGPGPGPLPHAFPELQLPLQQEPQPTEISPE
jgi:hypothetical protein